MKRRARTAADIISLYRALCETRNGLTIQEMRGILECRNREAVYRALRAIRGAVEIENVNGRGSPRFGPGPVRYFIPDRAVGRAA